MRHYVDIDRLGVSWHSQGSGKKAILWVHGYTMNADIWPALTERLPEFRHVLLDLPGHGRTPLAAGATIADMASILLSVAHAADVRTIAAMSFGAMAALEAAMNNPDFFETLLLAAPGLGGSEVDPEAADCNLELRRMAKDFGIGPWLFDRWLSSPPHIFSGLRRQAAKFDQLAAIIRCHKWEELCISDFGNSVPRKHLRRDLSRINANMFILTGDEDMMAFRRIARELEQSCPNAHRTVLQGVGHLPFFETPERAADWVRSCVSQSRVSASDGQTGGKNT